MINPHDPVHYLKAPLTRRRLLALGGATALVAVGCGDDKATQTPAPTTTASPTASATASPTATASASPTATASAGFEFTDDRGRTVTLPEKPVRVVAFSGAAAALWNFGIQVVGVFGPQKQADGSNDPSIGSMDLTKMESIGEEWGDIDLEKLKGLNPDLIVSTKLADDFLWYVTEEVNDAVEAMAPTIGIQFVEHPNDQTIKRFEELAVALGADVTAPDVVAQKARYDDAVAAVKGAVAANPGVTTLFLSPTPDLLYFAYEEYHPDVAFYKSIGVEVVTLTGEVDVAWEPVSWEQALKYPADLVMLDRRQGNPTPEEIEGFAPIWKELPAVKAGQVGWWQAEGAYSWGLFATQLENLAATIAGARSDVV